MSSDILERMDKFKKWQEQQERLMLLHHKRLNENNFLQEDIVQPAFIESRAIIPQRPITPENLVTPKIKKPFLRRGSGLSRFKMAPGEQFKAPVKNKITKESSKMAETEISVLKTPQQKLQSEAVWSTGSQEPNASLLLFEELEKKIKENSICASNLDNNTCITSSTPTKKIPNSDFDERHALHSNPPNQNVVLTEPEHQSYKTADEVYTDIVQRNQQAMLENKKQMEDIEQYEKVLHEQLLSSLQEAIKFKEFLVQDKAAGGCSPLSSISNDNEKEVSKDFNDLEKWDSNESLSTTSTVSSTQVTENVLKFDAATMTDHEKILECNVGDNNQIQNYVTQELKVVQDQYNEVMQLKKQLQQQSREFQKQKKLILKEVEEEKDSLLCSTALLEDEKRKLAKEKMVFERYVKDLQNKPNKKEREEISFLKEELVTLKETFKLKEVKNSTLQARLRNQIKFLEKENTELKLEVERLQKENGRLIATQRLVKKPSDTKLLHEINKNISKLAQDHLNIITEKQQGSKEKENNKSASNSTDTEIYDCKISKEVSSQEKSNTLQSGDTTCYSNFSTSRTIEGNKMSKHTEEVMLDGSRVVTYHNGNVKKVSADGNIVEFKYPNGDTKTTNLLEGTICYYYCEPKVCHTTKADGTETVEYPNGQIETHFKDGTSEIKYPNEITAFVNKQGDKIISLPNGQKEIHTKDHKRREYPDGTVKLLYPNGHLETRYSNGRVRIKDKQGNLLFDSMT